MCFFNSKIQWLILLIFPLLLQSIWSYEYEGYRYPKNSFPSFRINQLGTPDCSGEFSAIENAIQTWNNVNTTYISFQIGNTCTTNSLANDNTNLIMWVESGWENIFPEYPDAVAVNSTWISGSTALESDILLNGEDYLWSDNGTAGRRDVQNVVTHEIGHSIGLGDLYGAGDTEKTMYAYVSNGETKKRSLEADDENGARYVNFDPLLSGTLSENQVWQESLSGTQSLTGNVLVPSGITLTVTSNAAVNLNSYSVISTGGTINSNGTLSGLRASLTANTVLKGLCGRIQVAANYAGSTNEIYLENGNFNENVNIYNKSNLSIFGNQNYNPFGSLTVTACDVFQATGFGARNLYISNSGYLVLYGLNVDGIDQTYTGLYLYDCDTYDVSYITSQYSQLGVQCTDGTEADIEASSLFDNLAGLSSFNGSNVNISNSFFCGTALDLTTYNSSSINSSTCYFDGGTPSTSGSNIQHTGDQRCSLRKAVSNQLTESSMDNIEGSEFGKINSAYFDITKRLGKAFKDKTDFSKESYCAEYEKIIADYKNFIDKNPDSPLLQTAVNAIAKSCKRIDDLRGRSDYSSMKNFLQSVIDKKEYASIVPVAERQMVDYYRLAGDFTSAVTTADNLVEKYENNKDYVCGLLFAKGLILAYNLNQTDMAVESFTKIVKNYPGNALVEMAENQLGILGYDVQKGGKEVLLAEKSQLSISNHPNPFNPSTTIKYNLPKEGKVAIRIFDILGRQVAELVNDYKQAGNYSVLWNGKDGFGSEVSSGVYFYNIQYNDQSFTKKMMLIR